MAKNKADSSKSRGPGAFKLFLIVLILLLIPTTMEQFSMHQDTVKLVGRVCVGIGVLIFAYGLMSKVLRLGGLVILVLIVARVLANEGVIEVPKLLPKLEAEREKDR
jgi:drug/metabolite transporter (DMT)-like permease